MRAELRRPASAGRPKRARIAPDYFVGLWLVLVVLALVTGLVVAAVAVTLFGLSLFLLSREGGFWIFEPAQLREIGSSVLTGSFVALALLALQLYLNEQKEKETKEEQFRLTLATAKDLTGLDPPLPLAGLNLPDKVLDEAELAHEDLTGTNLAGASL